MGTWGENTEESPVGAFEIVSFIYSAGVLTKLYQLTLNWGNHDFSIAVSVRSHCLPDVLQALLHF